MSDRTIEVEVLRYRPEQDNKPFFQTYSVPVENEWVVLDALNYIKDELDRHAQLSLVVPHVRLRQLRHDGQRRAEAVLQGVPEGLHRQDPRRTADQFSDRARPA